MGQLGDIKRHGVATVVDKQAVPKRGQLAHGHQAIEKSTGGLLPVISSGMVILSQGTEHKGGPQQGIGIQELAHGEASGQVGMVLVVGPLDVWVQLPLFAPPCVGHVLNRQNGDVRSGAVTDLSVLHHVGVEISCHQQDGVGWHVAQYSCWETVDESVV